MVIKTVKESIEGISLPYNVNMPTISELLTLITIFIMIFSLKYIKPIKSKDRKIFIWAWKMCIITLCIASFLPQYDVLTLSNQLLPDISLTVSILLIALSLLGENKLMRRFHKIVLDELDADSPTINIRSYEAGVTFFGKKVAKFSIKSSEKDLTK